MKYLLLALVLALPLGGCNPYLTQQSVAPPGRSARLDEVRGFWGLKHYRIELSEGVALALTCNQGTPCEKTRVISDDPAIAEVRPASLSALERVDFTINTPASAFVVVGKAPGTTKLHVTAKEGKREVVVTVIGPPPPANQQTVAAP
jgi:hypothetical protein